jgi:hypothetical protein
MVVEDAGVKLKGHGSYQPIDEKPSWTVHFAEYSADRRMRGLKKIHLNNSLQDATYLKEQLASELFRAANVPVPRVAHALVRLNGRSLGLYVVKEGYTRDFIRRHFEAADGELYDDDDGHDIDHRMDLDLPGSSSEDQVELKRLADAALEPDLDRRWQRLERSLDVDQFLTFMAMELMTGQWDGYCLGQNNFRVYHDPRSDKIVFLPSGLDQALSKADLAWKPGMTGLVARSIMETAPGRERYAARFGELFEALFDSVRITRRLDQSLDILRSHLPGRVFSPLRRESEALRELIVEREWSLREQLRRPEPAMPHFDGEVALLSGWKPFDPPVGGSLSEGHDPGSKPMLRIMAGARTAASWRTTVRLKAGRYVFRGRARVIGVSTLPFGSHQGAALRVAGAPRPSAALVDTTDWEELRLNFEVRAPEEEVVLICQLRASAGEAWFDRESLRLVRER